MKNSDATKSAIEPKSPTYGSLGLVALGVVVTWGASALLIKTYAADAGGFGDMFGAVNALFSGLAFATLIYTMWLQRYELQLQREELKSTREELKGQKDEMVAQNKMLRVQNFENKFFQMLHSFNEVSGYVKVKDAYQVETFGKEAFVILSEQLLHLLRIQDVIGGFHVRRDHPVAYPDFYRGASHILETYFLMLVGLLRFVDRSDIEEKSFYCELVRNQLSRHELVVLYYQSASNQEEAWAGMSGLMERYGMFKHLPTDMLAYPEDRSLFSLKAYGAAPNTLA